MAKHTDTKRQAVIVIHGIGDQQPMATLRGFVESALDISPDSATPAYYSRPDTLSHNFELRCLTTPGNTHPQTDFFEFYWQHLMPKAEWSQIFSWAWFLMHRSIKNVPQRFLGAWWALWIGAAAFGILIVWSFIHTYLEHQVTPKMLLTLPFGAALIWLFLKGLFLSSVGDAAIYLIARPENVAARHAIRSAGVELLDSIHKSGEYTRVIVVGHSLGSVIGYDILNYAWQVYHKQHGSPENPRKETHQCLEEVGQRALALNELHALREKIPMKMREEWFSLVRKVGNELRMNKHRWLVTDFVTLGSPLAHADLLLARNREELQRKIREREFPCSPPVVDDEGTLSQRMHYELQNDDHNDPKKSKRTTFVPHHAAWTACVRWTNLYFPCRLLLKGDFVGGLLAPLFGPGINDVPVHTRYRGGWLAHTHYWHRDPRDRDAPDAPVRCLHRALDLKIWREER